MKSRPCYHSPPPPASTASSRRRVIAIAIARHIGIGLLDTIYALLLNVMTNNHIESERVASCRASAGRIIIG